MITSADNPKVKRARTLLEPRGRRETGLCLAEGVRLIDDAMRAGIAPALIFFASPAAESPAAAAARAATLAAARAAGAAVEEVSPAVLATLTDTVTSQGLVAMLPIPWLPQPPPPGPPQGLLLVLDQVRDPGNAGTILRSAAAAGVEMVLLAVGSVDPWNPKALRAGMGAHFRVPLAGAAGWDEIARLAAGRPAWLADADGELRYDQVNWTQPAVLIMGGETAGFSPQARSLARGRVSIPMARATESLNVAMAATVLLFEAARQARKV